MIRVSQLSAYQFIMVEVDPSDELGAPVDPTGLTVQMGFSRKRGASLLLPFYPAQWQINTKPKPAKYYVACPIGSATAAGTFWAGVWWPFAKIASAPEDLVLPGDPFRVDGELKPAVETTYEVGTSLPDLWVEWLNGDNQLVPFGTEPYTFVLTLWNRLAPVSVVLTKSSGFIGADRYPNLKVVWSVGDIATLPIGVYDGQIVATRVSDAKVRQVPIVLEIV